MIMCTWHLTDQWYVIVVILFIHSRWLCDVVWVVWLLFIIEELCRNCALIGTVCSQWVYFVCCHWFVMWVKTLQRCCSYWCTVTLGFALQLFIVRWIYSYLRSVLDLFDWLSELTVVCEVFRIDWIH